MRQLATFFFLAPAVFFLNSSFANEPHLTFYLSFDKTIHAAMADAKTRVEMVLGMAPQFADGISGKGLLTGAENTGISFDGLTNISPEQWTISLWMKGLSNADWNGGRYLEHFWSLSGSNGATQYFYHYTKATAPWLYSRRNKEETWIQMILPTVPEKEWHQWVATWKKGGGTYLYLDGQLVGLSATQPPELIKKITVGQQTNILSPPENNKIIDEFKIYDKALDGGIIAENYWRLSARALGSLSSVAPTVGELTLDGRTGDNEWPDTTGFKGLVDRQTRKASEQSTEAVIAHDAEYLYLLLQSDNPPAARQNLDATVMHGTVKRDATKNDGDVENDDHFLIQLQPNSPEGKTYTILVNGSDTIYDAADGDVSWNSGARSKSNPDVDRWTVELAIPLKSLGGEKIADGTVWRANFARVWKQLRAGSDIWEPNGMGTLRFNSTKEVQTRLNQLEFGRDGTVEASLDLHNPANVTQEIVAMLTVSHAKLIEKRVTLEAGQHLSVKLSATLEKANGALIGVEVNRGDTPLFRQATPFIQNTVGHIQLWKYPSDQKIRIGWELFTDADPSSLHLEAKIRNADEKVVQTVSQKKLKSLSDSVMIAVEDLAEGNYEIEVKIADANSMVQQQVISWQKNPLPEWFGNHLGISNTPPTPWTDVKVDTKTDSVSIWGRTHEYAQHLLPVQIVNQGKDMLSAPMRFVIEAGDQTQASNATKAESKWKKISATQADSLRSQKFGALQISSASRTEFDGMTWNEFVVENQGKDSLKSLTLEIPLKREWSELFKPYDDYRLKETGPLPKDGWKGPAMKMPWIGSGDGGFQIFQEQVATWKGSRTIEILPQEDGSALIRIHIVDEPTSLDHPLAFSLGWIAAPVKPAPRDLRDWRLFNTGPFVNDLRGTAPASAYLRDAIQINPGIKPLLPWWQSWWKVPEGYKGNVDHAGSYVEPRDDLKTDAGILLYHDIELVQSAYSRLTGEVGTATKWFAEFADEWAPDTMGYTPDSESDFSAQKTIVSQASSSLRDYFLWGFDQLMARSHTKSLYFDVSRPIDDTNIYHGAGVQQHDGSIEPTRNILGLRESMKRIYTLLKQRHPDGILFDHMSGEVLLPVFSFVDAMVDGENYSGILDRKDNPGYEKVLSVDQFRTEYSMQNNLGCGTVFLAQFERAKSITPDEWNDDTVRHVDYLLGLTFLHDSALWWSYMPANHLAQAFAALDSTGLRADWTFVPYWHQKLISLPQNVYASIYQSPNRKAAVLVIMNTSGKEQQIHLPKNLAQDVFPHTRTVYPKPEDAQRSVRILNNSFAISVLEK